jgi:hypothetical protein
VPLVPAKVAPVAAAPAPVANPQAEARRDYELAVQIGNRNALNAFLAQYPDGYYASLAKLQIEKIAAEEARIAATEKARLAEQERARLASDGAQKAQQARAEADAKAAEQARIAAEKAKQVAQEQAAAAERSRNASEKLVGIPPATEKPQGEKAQAERATNLASLNPGPPQADLTKSVQTELRRVGCFTAAADGEWNAASQRSMALFNRHAGTRFDVKLASLDALDALKLKSSRVCPLVCEHGFKAEGDRCSRISCAEGSFLNDDNECEKRRAKKPVASRDSDEHVDRPARERPKPQAGAAKPQAPSGQIVCDDHLCRPVDRGCRVEFRTTAQGGGRLGGGGNVQVCN